MSRRQACLVYSLRLAIAALLLLCGWTPRALAGPPRFFVVVNGVTEADGVHSGIVEEAKRLFVDELGRHAELTLTPPAELGTDVEALRNKDPDAFKAALRTHKLRAIELTLRILGIKSELEPPPEGKPFRVLKRGISLSVFGVALPDKIMAIGGDGDSTIATEIRKNENEENEGRKLLSEATKVAIAQAVDMTVTKLKLPPPKDPTKPRAKKKK